MIHKIHYAGEAGDGFGWGVCNANLIRALKARPDVQLVDATNPDAIVFMPIADHDLEPSSTERGWKNVGYTFFEYPLGPKAAENAKRYDLIFAGSTWCQERLAERGIKSTVLIQGVDTDLFKPGPGRPPDAETWIFSGGKFEYRKGQDLVLAAFKEVLKTHPRTRLITAWRNPWPSTMDSMAESKHIKYELKGGTWPEQLGHLCEINGIPKDKVLTLPGTVPNRDMPSIYQLCDFGVFPNRCEGGTNLVMMEFMACGRPVVATWGHGHKDIANDGMLMIVDVKKDNNWAETNPVDLWSHVMQMMEDRVPRKPGCEITVREMGVNAAESMRQWTWERAARTIVEAL